MVEEEHELELENALFANVLQDEMDMIESVATRRKLLQWCHKMSQTVVTNLSSNQSASNAGLSLAALTEIYLG